MKCFPFCVFLFVDTNRLSFYLTCICLFFFALLCVGIKSIRERIDVITRNNNSIDF